MRLEPRHGSCLKSTFLKFNFLVYLRKYLQDYRLQLQQAATHLDHVNDEWHPHSPKKGPNDGKNRRLGLDMHAMSATMVVRGLETRLEPPGKFFSFLSFFLILTRFF